MNIIMIASSYYPLSDVSTLRIHSYCKALADYGILVKVFVVYPPYHPYDGEFEGVHYSAFTQEYRSNNIFFRTFQRIKGAMSIASYIKLHDVKFILSYHDNLLTNLILKAILFCKCIKIPLVIDKTEYPYGYYKMNKIKRYLCKLPLKIYDGFIVISEELKRWYSNINNNVFLLPMTISPHRFDDTELHEVAPYIAVTFGVHNRDGLLTTIEAYKIYCEQCQSPYDLMLIGDMNKLLSLHPELSIIKDLINLPHLKNKIIVKGKVPINEVPQLLRDAKILLTTSPGYNSGGFPTKLGEYLLSGVPVVATAVGEIPNYLRHRYDIMLSLPEDVISIANNLILLQNDNNLSKLIAKNAYNTVTSVFNASSYCNDILSFLTNLSLKRDL